MAGPHALRGTTLDRSGAAASARAGTGIPDVATDAAPISELDPGHILDELGDAILAADADNRIIYLNPAAERLLRWPRAELEGRPLITIVPPRLRAAHLAGFGRYVATGEPRIVGSTIRVPALRRDEEEVEVELTLSAFRLPDDRLIMIGSMRDLTERVAVERAMTMAGHLRATSEVAVLLGLSEEVSDLEQAASRVLAAIGESLGWDLGALWLVASGGDELRCVEVWRSPTVEDAEFEEVTRRQRLPRGVGLPGKVWASGHPEWISDLPADPSFPRAAVAARQGLHGAFAFPITAGTEVLGVVEFFSRHVQEPDPDVLGVVATVGGHLGLFIERRRAEAEAREQRRAAEASHREAVELARTLQASLLPPHLPAIDGLDLAASYQPVGEGIEVGGDFYDLFPLVEGHWGAVIGDVCGKGAEAAVLTALARHTVRASSMHRRRSCEVLADLNEAMLRHSDGVGAADPLAEPANFCTALYLRLEVRDAGVAVELCCGGHPAPLLVRADGSTAFLECGGSLLGAFPEPDLTDANVELGPGETLVLYTDGVVEARADDRFFDQERLAEAASAHSRAPAGRMAAAIEEAARTFAQGKLRDDLAILVLHVPDPWDGPGGDGGGAESTVPA